MAPSPPAAPGPAMPKPDFTGTWLNTELGPTKEAVDKFFKDGAELNFIERNLAWSLGYGKDKLTHVLTPSADGKTMSVTLNLPAETTWNFTLDGDFRQNHEKDPFKASLSWKDNKLVYVVEPDGPARAFNFNRYLEDADTMIVELYFSKKPDLTMWRRFKKQ